MSTLERVSEPLAVGLVVTENDLIVSLADGRSLSVPIAWYPRLANATPEQRRSNILPTLRVISSTAMTGGFPLLWIPQIAVVHEWSKPKLHLETPVLLRP